MPINFQQTDTVMACAAAAFCSGASLNTDQDYRRQATDGGTAGATGVTVTLNASAADLAAGWYECIVADGVTWNAGNFIVRLNVTTAQADGRWDACSICRVNSGCTNQATIGSLTGQNISLGTTGVKTMTISGASQTPGAGDKVIIVLLFDNVSTMTRNVGFTPNQLIDSPFTTPTPSYNQQVDSASRTLLGVGR